MTFWNLYFILKFALFATGHLQPFWLANLAFAVALAASARSGGARGASSGRSWRSRSRCRCSRARCMRRRSPGSPKPRAK